MSASPAGSVPFTVFRDGSAMDAVGRVHTLVLRAASRLLLFVTISVSVLSFPVAARTTEISLELDRNATAPCSELAEKLSRRRERLEAAIARVDAETARVEAQCAGPMHPANDQGRTDAGVPVALPQFFALTSVPGPRGTADDATGIRQVAPESVTVRSRPARRKGELGDEAWAHPSGPPSRAARQQLTSAWGWGSGLAEPEPNLAQQEPYAVECWATSSAFFANDRIRISVGARWAPLVCRH